MERRRHDRHPPAVGQAFVHIDHHVPLIDCDLINMSEGGARIIAKSTQMLPAHFVLFLTPDGSERRTCRVIWRDGPDIGVAFNGLDERSG